MTAKEAIEQVETHRNTCLEAYHASVVDEQGHDRIAIHANMVNAYNASLAIFRQVTP